MTECEKSAIRLTVTTMQKNLGRYMNRTEYNKKNGRVISYPEAIVILERMVEEDDNYGTN